MTTKIKDYFSGVVRELKKVTWPTWKQVANHTVVVIISSLIVMAIVAGIDYFLSAGIEYVILMKQ